MAKSKLPKSLTRVTTFSKILAVLLFFLFIAAGVLFGMKYQRALDIVQFSKIPVSSVAGH